MKRYKFMITKTFKLNVTKCVEVDAEDYESASAKFDARDQALDSDWSKQYNNISMNDCSDEFTYKVDLIQVKERD